MRRILLCVLAVFAGTFAVHAQQLRDMDIRVVLQHDGSARITQIWDATVVDGTEMYIPISNLGEMTVSDLAVSENGQAYINEGRDWDVDRSLDGKAGRCGIIDKHNGVELCWGKTSYGPHVWTVEYTVTGLVQSFTDADGFNFMFVNPGFDAPAQHVKVTILNDTGGPEWTYDNTLVWGFGSYGDIEVVNGAIVYESSEPYSRQSSCIALVRFEKGLFAPTVSRNMTFDELKDRALEDSSYGQNGIFEQVFLGLFALLFGGGIIMIISGIVLSALGYKYKKSMYGKTKITEWWREAPMGGNLFASSFVLDNGWRFPSGQSSSKGLIGAFFLRWILDGKVKVQADPGSAKRVNLEFKADSVSDDDVIEDLYQMARSAAGDNRLLEKNEFEKWSTKNYKKMSAWPDRAIARGKSWFRDKGYFLRDGVCTEEGAREACHVVEFKNFLKDFTLSDQRGATEVGLWKDYLVYAQLFGIADKVADQFKKLYPAEFSRLAQETGMDTTTLIYTMNWTNSMSTKAFTNAVQRAGSISGTGGHTSFGGGGGFSGGGFGGGGR